MAGAVGVVSPMLPAGVIADDFSAGLFAQEVEDLLRFHRPSLEFHRGDSDLELSDGNQSIHLDNLWPQVRSLHGGKRLQSILDFVDTAVAANKSDWAGAGFAAVRSGLMPRIVHTKYIEHAKQTGASLVDKPWSLHTRMACVFDSEAHVNFVTNRHVSAWAVGVEDVWQAALANLDARSRRVTPEFLAAAPGGSRFAVLETSDGYAAARIVAPHFMARIRDGLGPKVYVGVPTRDLLLAWPDGLTERRKLAAFIADLVTRAPYPLTNELFVSTAEGVRPAMLLELADHGR